MRGSMPSDRQPRRAAYREHSTAQTNRRPGRTPSRDDRLMTVLKLAGAALAVAAIVALCVFGIRAHQARTRACQGHGGHVTHHTTYTTIHGHTDSDTTYYCATTDRGIIDVW